MSDVGELKEGRYRSRPHSKEEKKKQKRDWEKRRKEERRRKKREEKRAKKQPPCVSRTPEGPDEDETCAKVSHEDEKSVASKKKRQLNNSPNKVSCRKGRKRKLLTKVNLQSQRV